MSRLIRQWHHAVLLFALLLPVAALAAQDDAADRQPAFFGQTLSEPVFQVGVVTGAAGPVDCEAFPAGVCNAECHCLFRQGTCVGAAGAICSVGDCRVVKCPSPEL